MGAVADQVLGQFAANFATKVQAMQAQAASPTAAAPASAGATPAATPGASPAATEPKPLNGLALLWAVIKGWFSSLFATKKS